MMERLFLKFAKALARVYLGGAPYRPQKRLPEILFYPVIFANGRDDDSEGLKAFYENRPYIFRGKVYQPTTDPRTLDGIELRLSHGAIGFLENGRLAATIGYPCLNMLAIDMSHGLARCVSHSRVHLNSKVLP